MRIAYKYYTKNFLNMDGRLLPISFSKLQLRGMTYRGPRYPLDGLFRPWCCSNLGIFDKFCLLASFNNLKHSKLLNFLIFDLGHCKCKDWPKNQLCHTYKGIFLKFYKDWLSCCKISKVIKPKVVFLSCDSQNQVYRPFLKTSLTMPTYLCAFPSLSPFCLVLQSSTETKCNGLGNILKVKNNL